MKRSEREITDHKEIEAIIERADVCCLGLVDGKIPYVIPMNFGYKDNCLYFHCAKKGKKIDIIKRNNSTCFEMDIDYTFHKVAGRPCKWGAKYRSVIGFGKASIVENSAEKLEAMNIVTRHYGGDRYPFSKNELETISIIKIEIASVTGKKSV